MAIAVDIRTAKIIQHSPKQGEQSSQYQWRFVTEPRLFFEIFFLFIHRSTAKQNAEKKYIATHQINKIPPLKRLLSSLQFAKSVIFSHIHHPCTNLATTSRRPDNSDRPVGNSMGGTRTIGPPFLH